ncbi:NEMO protein, partial [Ceuthmochares aereus]|nr:NEMO protein [Ceuthmochares aereus]
MALGGPWGHLGTLTMQAEIFRVDFAAERAAREQLHAQREALQAALEQLRLQLQSEGAARARLDEMCNRHSDPRPSLAPGEFGGHPPP